MKGDVVIIGPLNVDLLITGQAPTDMEDLRHWAGPSNVMLCAAGSAGYIAQDLVKFGLKTGILSVLADDPFGDAILRILDETGLDVSQITRQKETLSGIGIYFLLLGSKKRPLTYRLPTHLPWPKGLTRAQMDYLLSHRHLHCAGYLHFPDMWDGGMAGIFSQAKEKGLTTSLDPQFPLYPVDTPWMEPLTEVLKFTDLLVLDEDEARNITRTDDLEEALKILRGRGAGLVSIKRGERGSISLCGQEVIIQEAFSLPESEIVESIGAGDAFDTGLIFGFLQNWDFGYSLRFASMAAATTLRGPGGTLALESVAEIRARVENWH